MDNMIPSFAEANKIFQKESPRKEQNILKIMSDEIRKSANNGEIYAEITLTSFYDVQKLRKTLRKLGYYSTYEECFFYKVRCYLIQPWWYFWR